MIAIIIPTSNNIEYLQRCLETLVDYTQACEYRLVVVDNGSSDGTADYLLEVSQRVETEIITNKENLGFIKATNQGIASAIKENNDVLLLNDDTQITDPMWLNRLFLNLSDNVGAVGPVSNYAAGLQNIQISSQLPEIHETSLLVGFCMLIRRDALQETGFLDEYYGSNMFDDFDYSIRLRKAGFKLAIDRSVFVYHYGSKTLMREPELFNTRLSTGERLLKDKWGNAEWENAKRYPQSLIDWGIDKMRADGDIRVMSKQEQALAKIEKITDMPDVRREKLSAVMELSQQVKEGVIVELGAATGISACAISMVATVPVYTIDHYKIGRGAIGEEYLPDDIDAFRENCKELGVNPNLIVGDAADVATEFKDNVSLLLWDIYGDRLFDDFLAWESKIPVGGTFAAKIVDGNDIVMERIYNYPGWSRGKDYSEGYVFTAVKTGTKKAAFWIVDGNKYVGEASVSADSLKRHMPDIDRVLFVTGVKGQIKLTGIDTFKTIINLSARQHEEWYADRMRYIGECLEYLKDYDSVLELDTDTYFLSSVPELFDMLDHFDIAMALAPGHRTAKTRDNIPLCYSEYNNGVVVERNNQEVRDLWNAVYEELIGHIDIYGDNDQAPLRQILFNNPDVSVATLTAEYNCRFPFGTHVSDNVKILHGRCANYELVGMEINQAKGIYTPEGGTMRVWKP